MIPYLSAVGWKKKRQQKIIQGIKSFGMTVLLFQLGYNWALSEL